jgi:hypothetical protein
MKLRRVSRIHFQLTMTVWTTYRRLSATVSLWVHLTGGSLTEVLAVNAQAYCIRTVADLSWTKHSKCKRLSTKYPYKAELVTLAATERERLHFPTPFCHKTVGGANSWFQDWFTVTDSKYTRSLYGERNVRDSHYTKPSTLPVLRSAEENEVDKRRMKSSTLHVITVSQRKTNWIEKGLLWAQPSTQWCRIRRRSSNNV